MLNVLHTPRARCPTIRSTWRHWWRCPAEHCCPPEPHGNSAGVQANPSKPLSLRFPAPRTGPACQRHNLVSAHASVRRSAKRFESAATPAATGSDGMPGFADAGVISRNLELDFRMRQKPEPVPDLLRYGDLPLACNLHGITPTSKSNRRST